MNVARSRPAETLGAGGTIGGVVYGVVDHNWAAAVIALVGLLPAVATFWIVNGGARGLWALFVRGRAK